VRIDAILPAGGRIRGSFAGEAGTEVKALIEFGGRTLAERTIDALRGTGCIERIVVVGAEEIVSHPGVRAADAALNSDPSNSGPTNIIQGLQWLREARGGEHPDRALVVTTDLPFLSPDAVIGFIELCPEDADICVPLISREEYVTAHPGATNLFVPMRDGQWTIGCAFLVRPEAIERNRDIIERVFRARKSQIGMARLLGIGLIARFLTRRLTVPMIEERCRAILGCSARAIRGCSAELAFDVDYYEDYRYAQERLRTQQ